MLRGLPTGRYPHVMPCKMNSFTGACPVRAVLCNPPAAQDLDVPDHVHNTEKKRNGVTRTTVAFGFPLAADGQAAVLPGMHAFAFLPVFPSGLSFMVQVGLPVHVGEKGCSAAVAANLFPLSPLYFSCSNLSVTHSVNLSSQSQSRVWTVPHQHRFIEAAAASITMCSYLPPHLAHLPGQCPPWAVHPAGRLCTHL